MGILTEDVPTNIYGRERLHAQISHFGLLFLGAFSSHIFANSRSLRALTCCFRPASGLHHSQFDSFRFDQVSVVFCKFRSLKNIVQ